MKTNKLSFALLLFTLLLLPTITTARRLDRQLSLAISALRSQGYSLFPHAIAESSYLLRPPQNSTLTFFSPPDSLFFSPSDSPFRFVSPFRLPASRLRILSYGTCLNTLLPHHHLLIERSKIQLKGGILWDPVTVDGMRVSLPDLYIGSSIVVHGLDEVLLADSKVLQIEKTVTQYISSWRETGLFRSKNGTNQTEIEIIETGNPWID